MAASKSDKAVEYANYAKHCLQVVKELSDQDSRMIHRQMAAEWFKLADEAAHEGTALSSQASLRTIGKTDRG
jgi:DNA primase